MFDDGRQGFGRGIWLRSWLALAALFTFFLAPAAAHAGDGIGRVWTSDVKQTSFMVHWEYPTNYEQDRVRFEVCVKRAGSWVDACDGEVLPFANPKWYVSKQADKTKRSLLMTGMPPGERLKVKVICWDCKKIKKTIVGKLLGSSNRNKIGISEATTEASNPPGLKAAFWVSHVDPNRVTLSWKWSGPGTPSSNLRICVKVRWSFDGLAKCKNGSIHAMDGAVPITDSTKTSITIGNVDTLPLRDSKNYIFYLLDGTTVRGQTKATTPARP